MANTFLGIIIMLISTTIMNMGAVIQKKAIDTLPKLDEQAVSDNVKGLVKNKLWVLGWSMTTGAIVLQSVALGQADMTVIQPLIAWGLVVLVLFSHYYLGEKIRKNEAIGIMVAISGVIIMGLKAGASNEFNTLEAVYANYNKTNTYILFGCFIGFAILLWFISVKSNYKDAGVLFAICAATFSIIGLSLSKGLFTIVDIEGFGTTLSLWEAWALLAAWISQSTLAIIFQQMSLQRGKSIIVTPVFNLVSMVLPIITGAVIFGEVINMWKIISTLIIIIGAVLLSFPSKKELKELEGLTEQAKEGDLVEGNISQSEGEILSE